MMTHTALQGKNILVENLYRSFCREEFDQQGILTEFEPIYPGNFNFAYDVVDKIAALQPGRRAMLWVNQEGEEKTITFGELKEQSDRTAGMLQDFGVKKGDMVLLALKRHYQFWFSILALHKLGAVAICSTSQLTAKDYQYRFQAADISYVITTTDDGTPQQIDEACLSYPSISAKFLVAGSQKANASREGWIDFNQELPLHNPIEERIPTSAEDPLLLYFTSGTTGHPKMAWHDHTYPLAHLLSARHWQQVTGKDLHLTVADTGWAKASWGKLYGQWFVGATLFVYDFSRFDPELLMEAVSRYRVTTFCAPPTIFRLLINKNLLERYDLSSIRHATTAGEALNAEVFHQFHRQTGIEIMEGFGQSETTALCLNLAGRKPKPGSMGIPSPLYQIDLMDENGNSVPPGSVGELVVRTAPGQKQVGLFRGYYRSDELTRKAWYGDAYHTGDTAWRDEDGHFWYVGRVDDLINASGYRIGPFEIESVLMEHPGVAECAITGAADPIRGTVVKATIVLKEGWLPCDALKKELQEYVKQQTAPYKYPRVVEFVEALPKTFSGKIQRGVIRRQDGEQAARQEWSSKASQGA